MQQQPSSRARSSTIAQVSITPCAAEQAARPRQQDDDRDQVDDDLVDAGDDALDLVHRGEGLQDAEQEAGEHRAAGSEPMPPTTTTTNDSTRKSMPMW